MVRWTLTGMTDALHDLSRQLTRLAQEMDASRVDLERTVVALAWEGLAAEAVRGAVRRHVCALEDAGREHRRAAGTLERHAGLVVAATTWLRDVA